MSGHPEGHPPPFDTTRLFEAEFSVDDLSWTEYLNLPDGLNQLDSHDSHSEGTVDASVARHFHTALASTSSPAQLEVPIPYVGHASATQSPPAFVPGVCVYAPR